jgi:nucleoside-diphosphate-sugar epimerase
MIFANGTTGTIGKHLSRDVHGLKNNLLDYGQEEELENYLLTDSSLIHLAGVVGADSVKQKLVHSRNVNVVATESLAKYCLHRDIGKFVYVSTSHVYAPSRGKLNEYSDVAPISEYAKQKLETEELLQQIFAKQPEKLCIVRVFSILGWNMPDFTLGGAIEKVINNHNEGVLKEALSERDFLTPYSVAGGLLRIASLPQATGTINLCSGQGISVRDAATEMAKTKGVTLGLHNFDLTTSPNPRIVGDNTKLVALDSSLDLKWEIN